MKDSKPLEVVEATYKDKYRIAVVFSDGKKKVVDFGKFIKSLIGYTAKYKNPDYFKKFKIDNGNLVWGKDWDLIFPVDQLYRGQISI